MARRVYRAVSVKKVSLAKTMESLAAGSVQAGVDIGKEELLTVLRDSQGQFLGPWKTRQPSELRELVAHLAEDAEGAARQGGMSSGRAVTSRHVQSRRHSDSHGIEHADPRLRRATACYPSVVPEGRERYFTKSLSTGTIFTASGLIFRGKVLISRSSSRIALGFGVGYL
jgi:hypothetical protein